MSIRKPGLPTPNRYKYIINEEYAGKDKYFSGNFTYNDLLLAMGPDVKDYTDISQMAKNFYSTHSETLSKDLNPFYEIVAASGGIQDIDSNFLRWRVYSKPERGIISFGNPNPEGATCLGVAGFPFKIRVDVDWMTTGDLVAPIRNKQAILEIISEPTPVGGAYEYDVVLVESEATFPIEYLRAGDYFIKMGAITSWRASGQRGSINFGMSYAYVEFEVPMTTMQWEYKVEEEAHLRFGNLDITRCDENMNPVPGGTKLTNFIETEARANVNKEKELYMIYGRSSKHLVDKITGKEITTAPGLFEFLDQGQVRPYSPTSNAIDKIVADIKALWFDTIPISQRRLMLYTGEAGLELFHNWIEQKFGNTATVQTVDFVLGSAKPFESGRNGYSYGNFQFTEYKVPTFGSIVVAHWPILDNTRVNGVTLPGSYYPVSSFEFIAFDIGFGEPNIQMFKRGDKERTTYIPGMWSPFGPVGPNNPVYKQPTNADFDGYSWVHRSSFGLVVFEPDRMLRFVPAVTG